MRKLLFWLFTIILALISVGIIYEQWSRHSAREAYPPPGQLISMPWGKAHVHCLGRQDLSKPTVILQSGLDLLGSMSWATIQPTLSKSFRVCSYDRPGILWSDPSDAPRDAITIANELDALLKSAGERPPYILVAHSLGGLMGLVYADRHPENTKGLLLVDSSHHEQMRRLPREAVLLESSEPPPGWLVGLASEVGILRLFDPFPQTPLPESVAPARQFMPTSVGGLIAEVRAIEAIADQAAEVRFLERLPIVVLTRGQEPEGIDAFLSKGVIERVKTVWLDLQAELALLSSCAEQRTIPGAAHYIHHDRPTAVVNAIIDIAAGNIGCDGLN